MRKRSLFATVAIVMALALVALFAFNAAMAKDNPPGCKNPVPGDDGFKNPNCGPEGPDFGNCSDGIDNDGDGLTDGDDPDCQTTPPAPACSDGADNDGDGATDFPADPGCTDANDTDETDPAPNPACSDGADNDGDGATDFPADPGCTDANDTDETDPAPNPACSDGADNDGDGATDFPADPGCTDANDTDETDPVTTVNRCTAAAGDPGVVGTIGLTTNTLGQELWDAGLQIDPLTEDPEGNGPLSGAIRDGGTGTPLEPVTDEVACLVDLLIAESTGADL